MNKQTLRRMVGGGLFAAIIVVLQLIGGGIRFGTFSISLVLVPIVVGTAVYGWQMGGCSVSCSVRPCCSAVTRTCL